MPNLKPILDSTKISLERAAAEKFGAAVEDFTRGTLGPALGLPPTPTGVTSSSNRNDGSFYSSSYAAALAGGTSYRPKLKFLFKVEFVFTQQAMEMFPNVLGGQRSQEFTFMIKSVDRPKIDFEYEDVNQYNFWTKALKKIRHRELTMTFMDDTGNRVLNFFRALMMIHSPVTRRQMLRQDSDTYSEKIGKPKLLDERDHGMNFSTLKDTTGDYTAIRGTIDSAVGNAIETIRVKQIYVNSGSQLGAAVEETIFDFINARIISFDLDEVSHEGSDVNLVTMQFDYDWMEIVQVGPLEKTDGPIYDITVPGINGAPIDVSTTGSGITPQGGGNVFGNIITGSLGRAGQSLTSTAVNRAVKSIAGGGQFATLLGSHASNILGGLVGAASRNLGGSLVNQAGAAFTAFNVITPSASNVAPSSAALSGSVVDSAVGGRSDVEAVVTSWNDGSELGMGTTIK